MHTVFSSSLAAALVRFRRTQAECCDSEYAYRHVRQEKWLPLTASGCFALARLSKQQFRRKIRVRKVSKRIARTTRHNSFISTAKVRGARGQWREVLRLLDKMAEDGIPLNSYAYNSALSSIAKSGR